MNLVLYGPSGSGKTTVGRLVAQKLGREFIDGDEWIEQRWARPVAAYFDNGEEALFRAREATACRTWSARDGLVIAPGGGALLDPHSRAALEGTGVIVCLTASLETLVARLNESPQRPLLSGDLRAGLAGLLRERESLYGSFASCVHTDDSTIEVVAGEVINTFHAQAGVTRLELDDCSVLMGRGLLSRLPEFLEAKGLCAPHVVISDSHVAPLYGGELAQELSAPLVRFPAGEEHKTLDTVRGLYSACLELGLERGGSLLALGGGVVGDVAGFTAATYMRGVRWANLPTTVLAMADASFGGKVGVDLPEGKNLVGAFHSPALVLADFDTLATLPDVEWRCGLAEVIKAAIIGDADLFRLLASEPQPASTAPAHTHIARAAAVKVGIVNADPLEHGERARLNLGHTIGHGVETASGYALRHGEAVSIGAVAEAHVAEMMGLAERGLAEEIANCLAHAGLPVRCTGLEPDRIRTAMGSDKKKAGGKLKFALPRRVGEVEWGVEVDERLLMNALRRMTSDG